MQINSTDLNHPSVLCAEVKFQHAGYINQDRLLLALIDAEVPEEKFPIPPTEHVMLGRAMNEIAGRKDKVDTIGDGWVLTLVDQEKLDLEKVGNTGADAHQVSLTAKVLRVGTGSVLKMTPDNHHLGPALEQEWQNQQNLFKASEDLSKWLSQVIIPWVGGVASKARGGAYYVRKGEPLVNITKIQQVLDKVSEKHYRQFKVFGLTDVIDLPVVTQGTLVTLKPEFAELEAIRIMLNGIIEKTDRVCDELHDKLTSNIGERALKTQIGKAAEMEAEIQQYQEALGTDLSDLTVRLTELKNGLGIALLNSLKNDD
jgi:hypothetical protein